MFNCKEHLNKGDLSCDTCYLEAELNRVNSQDSARQFAIHYQEWASEQNLSYSALVAHGRLLEELAKSYNLTDEFRENGII